MNIPFIYESKKLYMSVLSADASTAKNMRSKEVVGCGTYSCMIRKLAQTHLCQNKKECYIYI
jgi:hypothetical protein